MKLIKPKKLQPGDQVATVSLSWGGAGDADLRWRYEVGKQRLQEEFGLKEIEMPHSLSGTDALYNSPEKRAEDLMDAFKDPNIKAIFANIGGDDSVRLIPYIDYDVIRNNPKIFIGYSDTTVTHYMCLKAGITSYYGPCILNDFAENIEMFDYTKHWLKKSLFEARPIGNIEASPIWTSQRLEWVEENKYIKRDVKPNSGYEILQGSGKVKGQLIGGCIEVLEMIKATEIWPSLDTWDQAILFLETSEEKPDPNYLKYWLRNYGASGILSRVNGIIFGKPLDECHYDAYNKVILTVIRDELKLINLPIMVNMNFGHTSPAFTIPYGVLAEIDCDTKKFSILESGVAE